MRPWGDISSEAADQIFRNMNICPTCQCYYQPNNGQPANEMTINHRAHNKGTSLQMAKFAKFIKLSNWLKNERIWQTFWHTLCPLCSHSPPFGHLVTYFNDRCGQNILSFFQLQVKECIRIVSFHLKRAFKVYFWWTRPEMILSFNSVFVHLTSICILQIKCPFYSAQDLE